MADTSSSSSTSLTSPVTGGVFDGTASFDADPVLTPLAGAREAGGGFLATQDALDLFAAAYGDVPGADAGRFVSLQGSGTMALRNIFRVFDELEPEQQDAVMTLVGGPAAQASASPTGAVAVAYRPGGGAAYETDLRDLVAMEEADIVALLGRDLGLNVEVETGVTFARADIYGDAEPFGGGLPNHPPYDTCRLRFRDDLGGNPASTVAHEVFHCFQFTFSGYTLASPDWVVEGQAEWVGARVGGADDTTLDNWTDWVLGSMGSLFNRDYDAAGFFWVIEQAGLDPWAVMPAMFGVSNEGAVAATGLTGAEVMRWAGTTTARADIAPTLPLSPSWLISAGDVPDFGVRGAVRVDGDHPYVRERTMRAFSASGALDVHLDGDIVTLSLAADAGAFQFLDGELITFEGSYIGRFCIDPGGCSCDSSGGEPLARGSNRLFVAVGNATGGSASMSITVEGADRGFADGQWTGELTSTVITLGVGGVENRSEPLAAPLEFQVVDGIVSGTYTVAMHQTIDAEGVEAEGTGNITGVITGCWYAPRMVATSYAFDGTIAVGGVVTPFVFEVPFEGSADQAATWHFDDGTDTHHAGGTLETGPSIDFMRSVGVDVNDVEITFQATNDR